MNDDACTWPTLGRCENTHRWNQHQWFRTIYPPDGIRPEGTGEQPKKKRGDGSQARIDSAYRTMGREAREKGLVPISDAHRAELRRKLSQLNVGVHCLFLFSRGETTQKREGEFVSYDDENIILLSENGSFKKVPIDMVFHGTYNIEEQGGKIK